ncbi:MAG: DUF4176 domain-containing protein [Clostridia bacterium]|nr:DUF4176 domain-containing protein [Clostridia bacterium]
MEIKDLLPIGSIVKLKGAKRKVMIFGVMQNSPSQPGVVHDYISVAYPEGHFDPRLQIAFDDADIEEVVFRGYEDPDNERLKFLATLDMAKRLMDKKKESAKKSEV